MSTKRLTIELQTEQYGFLKKEAELTGSTVSGLIRKFVDEKRNGIHEKEIQDWKNDPWIRRCGSFEGPPDLSENLDRYLYGEDMV